MAEFINQVRQTATRISRVTPDLDEAESRARHELTCARLAPKTEETLAELQRTRPKNNDADLS